MDGRPNFIAGKNRIAQISAQSEANGFQFQLGPEASINNKIPPIKAIGSGVRTSSKRRLSQTAAAKKTARVTRKASKDCEPSTTASKASSAMAVSTLWRSIRKPS
jgi:hypothetical protein